MNMVVVTMGNKVMLSPNHKNMEYMTAEEIEAQALIVVDVESEEIQKTIESLDQIDGAMSAFSGNIIPSCDTHKCTND